MSGIKVSVKTKAKETLKLSNHLRSYLFNAKKRCFCGKPVVGGSEYCVEHKNLVDDNSSGF